MSKILIVEDEEMLAEMYRDRFEAEDIEAVVAGTVQEARDIFKEQDIDLVLLDILLPRENGIAFAEDLQDSEVPVVAFSNYDEKETREKARELGVSEYLIKTQFTPAEIVERVKTYLSD